jgi:hypothetical protein
MLYPGVIVFITLIRNGAGPSEKVGVIVIGTLVSIFLMFVPLLSGPFPARPCITSTSRTDAAYYHKATTPYSLPTPSAPKAATPSSRPSIRSRTSRSWVPPILSL